jgi:hypothetical protein
MRFAFTIGRSFSADEWRLYSPGKKYRKTFDELPDPRQRKRKKTIEARAKYFPKTLR